MKKLISIIIVLVFVTSSIYAQLISAKELDNLMKSGDVLVISTRKPSDYAKVHIKGAVNVDISSLNTTSPVKGMLKSNETLASILGKKGINKDKKIVLYCNTGVNAGRLYWILKYLGCKDVSMLNGHMKAWSAARKPVTRVPTEGKAVSFTPSFNKSLLVTKSYVKSKLNSSNVVLVDVRKKEDYDKGHIGNAVNLPHKLLIVDETKKLKSKEALKSIFEKKGITSDKEIILYCKTSTKAGIVFLVLKSILNYSNVKIYDGAYNEWKPE